MDLVIKKIHLLINGEIHDLKIIKTIYEHDAKDDLDVFQLSLSIGYAEYANTRAFNCMEFAIIDLQMQLPSNILIACCQTCKHGNFCPYGVQENQIFCFKNYSPKDKSDVIDVFDNNTQMHISSSGVEYAHLELPVNELLHRCDKYDKICNDYYTYNDWMYHFKKDSN